VFGSCLLSVTMVFYIVLYNKAMTKKAVYIPK
jgi:hypothetical protein